MAAASDPHDLAPIRRLAECCGTSGSHDAWRTWQPEAWTQVESLAVEHGLSGLLCHRAWSHGDATALPPDTQRRLKDRARDIASANLRRFAGLKSICAKFASLDIPVMLLKGAHLATEVYPDLSMRPMLDLDLLVPVADVDRAIAACHALGFGTQRPPTPPADPESRHARPMHRSGSGTVELHWTIASTRHAPGLDVDRLWARSMASTFAPSARVLAPSDLLLHVAVHAAYDHHLNQGLRPLFDLAEVSARFGSDPFWQAVVDDAPRWGTARGVGAALWAARELANAEVPSSVIDTLAPSRPRDFRNLLISQVCDPPSLRNTRRPVAKLFTQKGAARWRYGWRRLLPPIKLASLEFGMPATSWAFRRHYVLEVARRIGRHAPQLLRWQQGNTAALGQFATHQEQFEDWLLNEEPAGRNQPGA